MANLLSSNYNGKIFTHSGFTSTISSSFTTISTADLSLDLSGNLLTSNWDNLKFYVHAVTLDESSNLWSADLNATKIYGHAGISATISTSFASPDAFVWGLSTDSAGGC